jgi:hypothetical protein
MKPLPSDWDLRIMWTVATSSSIEGGPPAYARFAKMLYDSLGDEESSYELFERKESPSQET